MDFWMSPTMSQLMQTTLARVALRSSVSCASEKRTEASPFSYQKRSHFWRERREIRSSGVTQLAWIAKASL